MVTVLPPPPPKQGKGFLNSLLMGASHTVGPAIENYQNRKKQAEALREYGLDENFASLPPEVQKFVAAQKFAGGEKPMNDLQRAQQRLAEQKAQQIEGQQNFFNQLMGNQGQSNQQLGQQLQEGAQTQQSSPQNFLEQLSDQQLNQLSGFAGQPGQQGVIGNIAENELNRREKIKNEGKELEKIKRQTHEAERKFHSSYSKKSEEHADQLRESLPKKEMSLDFARNAIETGNLNYFSPDKIADATGIELFRTSKGAQLTTAAKENLLSNMGRVSARGQNVWFEQRLNSMFPKIGQSKEANLTVQEMLEGEVSMDRAYLDAFDKLSQEDEEKYGYVKKDIQKRAQKEVEPIQKQILKRSSYRMREIEEQEMGLDSLKRKVGKDTPKGTPMTLAMAKLYKDKFGENALKVAEKNGYYIPTLKEFELYRKVPQEFREGFAQ